MLDHKLAFLVPVGRLLIGAEIVVLKGYGRPVSSHDLKGHLWVAHCVAVRLRDPDMCFEILDDGSWEPVSYRNAPFRKNLRIGKAFSRKWDRNIRHQGFLEAPGQICA